MGAGLLRGAGHGFLLHPDRVSRPSQLAADTMDGPWARQQQRAHRLTNSQPRQASATQYSVHERVAEPLGAGMARQPALQPVPQDSMEMPDSPSAEEDTDEGFVGYPPLPRGIKPQPISRRYVEPNRSGERLSHRDWYELPREAIHEGVPLADRYVAPQPAPDAWVPPRPGPVVHLAKRKTFRVKGAID